MKCGHTLAYLADVSDMASLELTEDGAWQSPAGKVYRLCKNYSKEKICNWAIPSETAETLCDSCRLTCVIPDLGVSGNREKWYRVEVAKRRLIYSLRRLSLLPSGMNADPTMSLRFEFLSDSPGPDGAKVFTGHSKGRITINVAEADDAEREKRRLAMHEPYRTLLGHFRHEIG
ncbi:MAG: putative zinc-binding metallopeptidase, partial [Thermoguttaceae bacterium]